jgi:hypothetical protein
MAVVGSPMPVKLKVISEDASVRTQREATAQRVLDYFGSSLPSSRLLCFLDDDDAPDPRGERGKGVRGLYGPIHDNTPLADWPYYVADCIYVDDGHSCPYPRVVDDLVYLYGSTCANEVGLTMTLAHELQHAIQHANARKLWAVNGLVTNLDRAIIEVEKLTWADIPIEREARIVSKRAAVHFFGEQRVAQHIDDRIAEHITEGDVADWQFVRTLTPSSPVDLVTDTQRLFKRLKGYRSELEAALQEKKANPDFGDIDLNAYLLGA